MIYALGLGSNLFDRKDNLETAIKRIQQNPFCIVEKQSKTIETKPVGNLHQPDFLNCAILVQTNLSAEELLLFCLNAEAEMGRIRRQKWEARIIDIDILLCEEKMIKKEIVTIPHPELHKRAFVLQSLSEICPNWIHPEFNKTIKTLFEETL
jgi:2-amino-4-hydroxy-6-hydroxymethyldihydropteridine diphosphokinase